MNVIEDDKVNRILVAYVMFLDFLKNSTWLCSFITFSIYIFFKFWKNFDIFKFTAVICRIPESKCKHYGAKILSPKPSNMYLLEKLKKVEVTATEGMFVFVFVFCNSSVLIMVVSVPFLHFLVVMALFMLWCDQKKIQESSLMNQYEIIDLSKYHSTPHTNWRLMGVYWTSILDR